MVAVEQNTKIAVEEECKWLDLLRIESGSLTETDIGRKLNWRGLGSAYKDKVEVKCTLSSYDKYHVYVMTEGSTNIVPTQYKNVVFADEEQAYRDKFLNSETQIDNKLNNKMEKKMALKGIDEKTVVHCETLEQAQKVTAIAQKAGKTWINGKQYDTGHKWEVRGSKSCYFLEGGMLHSIDYFTNEGYKVIKADEFVKLNSAPKVPNVKLTPEQYQFNLDRLATETDAVVKKQLDAARGSIKGEAEEVAKEVIGTLKTKVESVRDKVSDEFTKEIEAVLNTSKEMLLEELRKGRTVINVGVGEIGRQYSISNDDHYMMEAVFKSLLLHKKIMLAGEAGTGKTYMGYGMASKLGLPFYKYSCSRDSSVHDLLGYKQPRSEEYLTTTFLNAYENGGVFLVDEYDAMPGDVALFFNGIADSSKSISIPHRDVNPIAKKHKDFYLIMCGNTWGKGSQDYSGRDFQDMALLDRFRMCRHHIGYDANLEKSMIGEVMYKFIESLRATMVALGSYLSTRNVEDIALLINSGESLEHVLNTMSADLEVEDKKEFVKASLHVKHAEDFKKFQFDLKRRQEEALKEAKKQKA